MERLLGLVRHAGNSGLMTAVEMSILATAAGIPLHLHTEGLRGTGKTTVLRAASRLLPPITRLRGCRYNCQPGAPHCPDHRGLTSAQVVAIGVEQVPMPFLEISHSAKIGTVAGSIDLARLVSPTDPAAALLPGTLPLAHRGIILVDEINRLAETAPELADILLDAMGTRPGRVQIEETGLPPVTVPVAVSIWAASNPDEDPGPLEDVRRQLSDRFDMVVPTSRPAHAATVLEVLAAFEQSLGHMQDGGAAGTPAEAATLAGAPPGSGSRPRPDLADYVDQIAGRIGRMHAVAVPPWMRQEVADLYARFGLESLRAAQALLLAMKLHACLADRHQVAWDDLRAVTPLVLHHRLDEEVLARLLQHVADVSGGRLAAGHGQDVAGARSLPDTAATPSLRFLEPVVSLRSDGWAVAAPTAKGSPAATAPECQGAAVRAETAPPPGPEPASASSRTLWQRVQQALGLQRRDFVPLDPVRRPPPSPLAMARPLGELKTAEWVKSEADLRAARRGG